MKKNKNVKKGTKGFRDHDYSQDMRDYSTLPTPEIQKVFSDFVNDYQKGDELFDDKRNNSTLEMVDIIYNTLYSGGFGSLEGFYPEIPTYNQLLEEKIDEFWEKVTNEEGYKEKMLDFTSKNPKRKLNKLQNEFEKDFPQLKKRTG